MLLNEKCPECGEHLVERKGKWGKMFIGCSGYPDCRYIKKTKKKKEEKKEKKASIAEKEEKENGKKSKKKSSKSKKT
jgi:DNA topoisomerase-1